MASESELGRLAQVLNTLRPNWPTQSCMTVLRRHAHHPMCDLAVAAVAIAVDETAKTPARLDQPGHWWNLARNEPTSQPPDISKVLVEPADVADPTVGAAMCRKALGRAS